MSFSKINALLLYAQYNTKLSYFDDWKDAFENAEEFDTHSLNICDTASIGVARKLLTECDLIIIIHSAIGDSMDFIRPFEKLLLSRKCPLVSFVANEVNLPLPSSMKQKIQFLKSIRADYVATQLPLEAGKWLYEECSNSTVIGVPHALNPNAFKPTVDQKLRKIDIGVRTNRYQPYLGDNDRNALIDFFQRSKFNPPLVLDINFKDRFDRSNWAQFLNSSKATISNEAGSFFLERDDKTVNEISEYVQNNFNKANPHLKITNEKNLLYRLRNLAPRKIRDWYKQKFGYANSSELHDHMQNEILDLFFKTYQRPPVYTKAISSRHFDAIGTKTLQILLVGKYNDILEPNVHYLELKSDYSNINEVLAKFSDLSFREKMIDTAHEFVLATHTYKQRARQISNLLK